MSEAAPKDAKAKPAAKTEAKPAAKAEAKPAAAKAEGKADAKPAAGAADKKAPAKATAKAGAKGAKPKAEAPGKKKKWNPEGPRKKSRKPLVPKPKRELSEKEVKATQEREKALLLKKWRRNLETLKHKANCDRNRDYNKLCKEAIKNGQPKPKRPHYYGPNKPKKQVNPKKAAKIAAKVAAKKAEKAGKVVKAKPENKPEIRHRRMFLQLTPLNQQFQDKFGFIFSQYIGKARERLLRERNVTVAVSCPSHPLHGKKGKLIYYTGKHAGFVLIEKQRCKVPFSILVRAHIFNEKLQYKQQKAAFRRRLHAYEEKMAQFNKTAATAVAAGKTAPTPGKDIGERPVFKFVPPMRRKVHELKKQKKASDKKPEGQDVLPPIPFPNAANPIRSRKFKYIAREQKKKLALKKKRIAKVQAKRAKIPALDAKTKKRYEMLRQRHRVRRGGASRAQRKAFKARKAAAKDGAPAAGAAKTAAKTTAKPAVKPAAAKPKDSPKAKAPAATKA